MREMGPEGQGQQIKVSDQRWRLQGEGTQGGYLEASEEAAAGPGSPFQPPWGSWRRQLHSFHLCHAVPSTGDAVPFASRG